MTALQRQPRASRAARRPLALCGMLAALVVGSACRQDMHDAPRYDPLEASTAFPNGSSARQLVEGTVPRGQLNDDELLNTGKMNGQEADMFPFAITKVDMDRGEQRFNIYCSPCHGRTGEGNGMVVLRGFPPPPSYHVDRLRTAPAGHFFDVMTNGFGKMQDYRSQVPVDDRWRIVAYIRALQLSHNVSSADVPADEMKRLQTPDAPPAPAAGAEAEHR